MTSQAIAGRFLTVGLLLATTAVAGPGPDPADPFVGLATAAGARAPLMRIGLEPGHSVELSSRGAFKIVDPATGQAIWDESFAAPVTVVAHGGPTGGAPSVYRVQVGAFSTADAAEAELARLSKQFGVAGVVRHDPDRSTYRVRLGEADARLSLVPLTERLRAAGKTEFWIAEEPARAVAGVQLRLVNRSYDSVTTALTRIAVIPEGRHPVEVDGARYRGVVELRLSEMGTVRPINWIGLEAYLLGVVPGELGPEVWPQIEALKAQSVAARTYAWRNRGQFSHEGFDLCATPRCQVYGGRDIEHPLSDRAVIATRDQVLSYDGEPIVALYTATCGGHTEDGREVFADQDHPYLKGVPCRAENDALASLRGTVSGAELAPVVDETGADVTRDWALLLAAGVLPKTGKNSPGALDAVTAEELRRLTAATASISGLSAPEGSPAAVEGLGEAASALLADLGWSERAVLLLAGEDVPALLRDAEAAALPADERRALAYLAWVEALRPHGDGKFHVDQPPSRARLAPALVRIAETYRGFRLREGVVSGVGQASVRLIQGKGEIRLPLARKPYLFAMSGGRAVPAAKLEIWPGDRVRFRTGQGGTIDFMEVVPPVKGTSDDRSAAVYSWEVRKTRRELEADINRRISIGRLRDLEVLRRGVSGRVAELNVIGTSGSSVVRGFDVRRLLDLRESLTVIEIQRNGAGEITAAVFAGKGWGHGVGLCQVGAYGMALRGEDYETILTHYYSGASLSRIGDDAP